VSASRERPSVRASSRAVRSSDESSLALALERASLDPERALAAAHDRSVKERLRDNTEEALGRGVFGVPTVRVGEKLFWGDDRLEEALGRGGGESLGRSGSVAQCRRSRT
jgi:2-hydroxychromene-2-carboxylate isomerase